MAISVGSVSVDVVPDARRFVPDLRSKLNNLPRVQVTVGADTSAAEARIAQFGRNLSTTVNVNADTSAASAEIDRAARDRRSNVNVNVDDQGSILSTTNRLGALLTAGIALGPAIVPAAAAAAAAIGAMGIAAAAVGAGIGTLVLGFSGVGDAVKAMSAAQVSAGRDAAKSAAAQVAAAEQVRSSEASLANTRANAADAATRAAKAVADAQRGVGDAAREAARGVEDALRAQVTAQRGVEDAARSAARGVQTALFSQEQAEQSLAAAQLAARQAQLSLTQAREDAKQSLEDLTLQVEDGALAQRRAVLGVQDAQDELNKTMADPKATQRQRDLAQLSFDEATQNLDEIEVRNRRLAAEKAAADKAGVAGSRQVQAATAGVATAEQRVQDARTQAAQAADAVVEARRAGDERMLAAQEQLAAAGRRVAEARVAGERRVAEAQERVGEAVAAQASQQRSSAFAISQAQAAVASAHRAAATAAASQSTALTKVQDAMAALTPQGRAFALFLFSLKGRFDALKETAQAGLLPGVQAGIQAVLPLFPILDRTVGNAAKAMGALFEAAGQALASPFWRDFFTMIQNTVGPNLTMFGQAIGNLATGFAGLLMAFQPLNAQLGAGLLNLTARFAEFGVQARSNAGFQAFMGYVQQVGPLVVSTIRSLAVMFGRIVVALAPLGPVVLASVGFLADTINRIPVADLRVLLVTIGALVVGFRIWAASVWLVNVAMNANPISLIIIGIVALVAAVVLAYNHFDRFREIVDKAWAGLRTGAAATWKVVGPILTAIAKWVGTHLVTAFNLWWSVVKVEVPAIGRAVKWYWDNVIKPVFSALWTFVGTTIPDAFRSARDLISERWDAVGTAVKLAWTTYLKPVFDAVKTAIGTTVPDAFDDGVTAIKTAWDKLKGYAKAPVKFILETVLNHGILAAFNSISEHLGNPVKHIDSIPLPKGFARGTEDHRAQIAHPNQPRLWAEPETGGEAYIPLAPSKRARSARILDDVARRFGYGLVKMANGGTLLTAGKHLRDMGYSVGEGPPPFGPIHRVHATHSRHYDGMALDINHGAGTSKPEQAALSRIVPYLRGLGLRVLFMVPNHYNHLHAEVPRGRGLASQIGGLVSGAAGAVADFLDPRQLITGPLNGLLARIPHAGSTFGRIVAGAPKMVAKMLVDKAEGFVSSLAGTGGDLKDQPGTGGFGGSARWAQTVAVVLRQLGRPGSEVGAVLRRIQFESGGNPNAINRWDINARQGHPSQGLMQTIPGTFNAYAGPYRSRGITDPLANIYAGVNYALQRYGSLAAIDPRNRPKGYDAGGYLQPGLTTVYNGTGKPEPVFTPEQFAAMRANGGSRGGLTINGDVHTASVEEFMREAAARQRLDAALHPIFA